MHNFMMRLALWLCSLNLLLQPPVSADDKPLPAARLESLTATPKLLEGPANLKGDFAVAQQPPAIEFVRYPGQWAGANLWSCWGEVICGSDGVFYAAIGDHGAPHGTSYLYAIDPKGKTVRQVVDYNATVGIPKTKYAPGKIHGGLVELSGDRGVYFAGYDGGISHTTRANGFEGHAFLRYDLSAGTTRNLGILVPDVSIISLKGYAPSHSLLGLAIPGKTAANQQWSFFHYDLAKQKLLFSGGLEPEGARALILTPSGRCYYGHRDPDTKRGLIVGYDPETHSVSKTSLEIPGSGILRAASEPDQRGISWCFSQDGVIFAFDTGEPKEGRKERPLKLTTIGKAFVTEPLYTATCVLDPQGKHLYYIPGAHGETHKIGTAVIQLDLRTQRRKVLCFLQDAVREQQKYSLGGTYGIALNATGDQLFVNWNGAELNDKYRDFGKCAAMVISIPPSER